jgi:hypothetical protein
VPRTTDTTFGWIPACILECATYSDTRSRVLQLVDDVLLGKTGHEKAWVALDLSQTKTGLQHLWRQRAALQKTLGQYVDARVHSRTCPAGTEEALAADAKARELLEAVARMAGQPAAEAAVVEALHGARDKHIFRLLASISDPTHSVTAKTRALEELPKRCKSLGDAVADWVKTLVRLCAMGNSMNATVVRRCLELARDCDNNDVSSRLLAIVETACQIFPVLGVGSFGILVQLFAQGSPVTGILAATAASGKVGCGVERFVAWT